MAIDARVDPESPGNRDKPSRQAELKVKAFLREWDAIGVEPNKNPECFDEYDGYATHLRELLESEADQFKILAWLERLATEHIGLSSYDKERTERMVNSLLAWWRRWKINERI